MVPHPNIFIGHCLKSSRGAPAHIRPGASFGDCISQLFSLVLTQPEPSDKQKKTLPSILFHLSNSGSRGVEPIPAAERRDSPSTGRRSVTDNEPQRTNFPPTCSTKKLGIRFSSARVLNTFFIRIEKRK